MDFHSVELFAGAGGLALGMAKAGFRHELVAEWERNACNTIRDNINKNHQLMHKWNVFEGDVRQIDYSKVSNKISLISGGPPCQPFSFGGKHRGNDDKRDMFPEAVRAVRELKPKAFIFENVKGLLRESFSSYLSYILLQLTHPEIVRKPNEAWEEHLRKLELYHTGNGEFGLCYRVVHQCLNAADYGTPQKRERVIFVGFRSDLDISWSFPEHTHSQEALLMDQWITGEYWERHKILKEKRPEVPKNLMNIINNIKYSLFKPEGNAWKTVRDAISDLPEPKKMGDSYFMNHEFRGGARIYDGHTGSCLDEPSKALKAGVHGVPGGENMVAYENGEVRYFTVRESARLQTFPDDYIFKGSWTETMRQLGNAVPVDLAYIIGKSVKKQLEKAEQI
ncbi:MAG: DNA cytosine methyltransferase [Magnetococcales bacterium]|nr:DNA cytosine methyltransferase [Magnetococcales bacterium]